MHLLFEDDLNFLSNNKHEIAFIIQIARPFRQDIGVQRDIVKCAILIMKSGLVNV